MAISWSLRDDAPVSATEVINKSPPVLIRALPPMLRLDAFTLKSFVVFAIRTPPTLMLEEACVVVEDEDLDSVLVIKAPLLALFAPAVGSVI